MARLDHVAYETTDAERAAAFYERFLGARIVRSEGHPVMAYTEAGALALHKPGGPGAHIAFRVDDAERADLARRLDEAGVEHEERDHEIAVGLFFRDPDGRLVEAITYRGGREAPAHARGVA
jgi:catechol 2,3-dioxygenase-like lactoylglutathione lyase family enzyme